MEQHLRPLLIPRIHAPPLVAMLAPLALATALVPGGVLLSAALLIVLIFRGRPLDALGTLVLVVYANPVLFHPEGMAILRYLPLLLGMLVMWPGLRITNVAVAWALAFMAALLVLNVLTVSIIPPISLLKAALFVGVLWTLFNTQRVDFEGFARRVDRFIPPYLLLSLMVYAIPAIAFAKNGHGFQGLMNHPQPFGVTAALAANWLLYRLWVGRVALSIPISVLTITGLIGVIFLSEARTALLGFVVALSLTWLVQMLRSARHLGLKIVLTIVIGAIGAGAAFGSAILDDFLLKRDANGSVLEAAGDSRGFLIEASLQNFRDHPVLGIGFGIPSDVKIAEITYAPVIGVPISIALEKGVWVSATLEEQGVVGMAALLLFLAALVVHAIRSGAYMMIPMLGFLLASNLGEMVMFSIAGVGLLQWVLVITAARIRG